MKTIFDKATRATLICRIDMLEEHNAARWGKMNLYQMLKHCTLWEEMAQGKIILKRSFLGRLFGKMALRDFIRDESPIKRNVPASPGLLVKESRGNIAAEKARWIALIEEHAQTSSQGIIHPFFGKVSKEEVGYLAYKHTDHHLRQFNC